MERGQLRPHRRYDVLELGISLPGGFDRRLTHLRHVDRWRAVLQIGDVARAVRKDVRRPDPHQQLPAGEVREEWIVKNELGGPQHPQALRSFIF